jgi:hypothetical protein
VVTKATERALWGSVSGCAVGYQSNGILFSLHKDYFTRMIDYFTRMIDYFTRMIDYFTRMIAQGLNRQ